MKYILLVSTIFLFSCSSGKVGQRSSKQAEAIKPSDFKKEKALTTSEVKEFYTGMPTSEAPALQDETLDLMNKNELQKISSEDSLVSLSLMCAKKDYNKAFDLAEKIFNRYQKISAYWNQVGNCHLNQGNSRKALLFYNKALELSPNYVPALNNIGVLYSRQGDDQKALIAFEKAKNQSRFAKTPRYNLARIYLRYGLFDSARPIFQGLLNDYPQDIELLNASANSYFMTSDYAKAFNLFQQIPKRYFERAEFGLNYSITLAKLGKKSEALEVYNSINKPEQKELRAYYMVVGTKLGEK